MTNATQNVGIGYQSLSGLTTGDSNTAVGSGSLYSLNTGNYNVAMGHLAGDAITSAQYSVAIGYGSLGAEVTRGTSVAIGYEALALQTHGSDAANSENVGIGFQAGLRNVTGTANTSVGFEAMKGASGQSNSNNVAIGKKALLVIETGSDNVAVGSEAGYSITTGHTNVFIGSAVGNATTINNSIGIGNDAMGAVPSGQAVEHAIGVDAMKGSGSTTDGINGNIAIGSSAGFLLTTGGNNTLIGYATADELLTGSNNTTLGRHSLGNADGDEDDNTCIGYNSGASIDNGNDNTIIGSGANIGGAGTGENQAVIGKGATGQADNSVTLGNADVTAVYMAQDSGATVHTAGIQFPASQVANGGANVLDDYEEGDHTATIVGSTSGNYVVNSTNDILRYTKIGRLVNIQGLLLIDSDNSASGTLRISLPFTIGDGTGLGGRSYGSGYLDSHGGTIAGQVNTKLAEGNAYFILVEVADNGSPTDINDSQVDGAFNIGVNFSYTV